MIRKRVAVPIALLLVVAILLATLVVLSRQRVARHRVFRTTSGEVKPAPPGEIPPVERWSETFLSLPPAELADLLEQIEKKHPDLYAKWSLAYLHARALLEQNERDDARKKLDPYLKEGSAFRDLALYHQSELETDPAKASAARQAVIFNYPGSVYREQAIEEELDGLQGQALVAFATRLMPSAPTQLRRDLTARLVERDHDLVRGLALLRGGTMDDAADRVSRALDKPELLKRMTPEQWAMLGETFQNHRHFDRAEALLTMALGRVAPQPVHAAMLAAAKKKKPAAPVKKKAPAKPAPAKPAPAPPKPALAVDDLTFSLGRSYFGDEKFTEAQNVYMRGANATRDPKWKCTFLWHAARAAQLRGDDRTAEQLMTASIAVPGKFPSATAALTQRLRTRLKQKRIAEANGDLALLRKLAPNEHALVEGALAYAVAMVGYGNNGAAVVTLNSVPPKLLDPWDRAEFAYWRARALEASNPSASFNAYLEVLRAKVPTHFAYFARQRLDSAAMAPKLAQELRMRDAQVTNLIGAKQFDLAKRIETDRILLSSNDRGPALKRLEQIYRELPAYREILELAPASMPSFPNVAGNRDDLLMAMGLYDEAVDGIQKRWGLRPARTGLTRAVALNRGSASKESIYAAEVLLNGVPDDYHPDLLPLTLRQLLYPRYFYDAIVEDAKKYGADPALVLAIMREESRFNPRAKSQAAARGLLQFIITTARDIGRDVGLVDVEPEDLYDPRVIIRLGAKYIAELSKRFSGNSYPTVSSYNAGPIQTALWSRLQPAPGDDFFLSSINFDETKHYVRKVMNSYRRYGEIYGNAGPQGGLRAEP